MSKTSIGHTCEVFGLFSDANEGHFSLKNDNCCAHTSEGGGSVGFFMTSCMLM